KISSMAAGVIWGTILSLPGCMGERELPDSVINAFEQACNTEELDGCVAMFTEDAQILPEEGPVVTGHEAIGRFLRDQMTPVISYNTETDMSLVRGDIAIEQGHYRIRDVRRGANVEEGKYLHVWRNVDGDWKLYRMIYNT